MNGTDPHAPANPDGSTLEVLSGKKVLFSSRGKWLHPLFELEEFLRREGLDARRLLLRDKIVGRAAALLIARLGFRRVHAGLLSEPGREVLEAHRIRYRYDRLVERILCQTERILQGVWDLEAAHRELLRRARLSPPPERKPAAAGAQAAGADPC